MLWQPQINNPSFEDETANQLLPSAQRANTNFLRPYRGYSSIRQRRSDAFADYNSLQLYLNKRRGSIKYTISYTLSKARGLGSGNGDNPLDDEGWRPTDGFDRSFFVGPTSYDRRHALVTTWTYQVPFMRDRRNLVASVVGGWELSGKTRWQSGQYLTPTGDTLIGGRRADYVGGEIGLPGSQRNEDRWFNTDVFAEAPDDRRGNAKVGMIEGPHLQQWDISLRKNFNLRGSAKLNVRADVFNVFNRVNFNNPSTNVSGNDYGQISGAKIPRQSQLSLNFRF